MSEWAGLEIVPEITWADATRFAVYFAGTVCLPGWAWVRTLGLHLPGRFERWALTAVLGVLWSGWLAFALGILGLPGWHWGLVWLPLVAAVAIHVHRRRAKKGRWHPGEAAGLLLVAAFVAVYLGRVSSGVHLDDRGLRLYGAWHSDKMTNMSPCAALLHEVPPPSLRMAGRFTPHHYFPHLFVATLTRQTGIDYVRGFWFYAGAAGVAITGLAVLAFGRRYVRSWWLACLGLVLFGLSRFDAEAKPLDLSLAMLLAALPALDRFRASGRRRWGVLAVGLVGTMPAYEAFHALAACLGLLAWWLSGVLRRSEVRLRTGVTFGGCLAAWLVVQAMFLGEKAHWPAKVVLENGYRQSYKQEWIDAARDAGQRPSPVKTLLLWKRGDLPDASGQSHRAAVKPTLWQGIVGAVVFEAGFVGYVLVRFVNVAVFGAAALWLAYRLAGRAGVAGTLRVPSVHRSSSSADGTRSVSATGRHRWQPSHAVIVAIAVVGFGLPCVVSWGHVADGRWWATPNLYRPATCAYLLLLLLGTRVLWESCRAWRRPICWLPLGVAAWQIWVLATAAAAPAHGFHHVDWIASGRWPSYARKCLSARS